MRILKPVGVEIELDDKPRKLLFTVDIIDEVQNHYDMYVVDVLNSIFSSESKENMRDAYNKVSFIFTLLLNGDVKRHNKDNPGDIWNEITEEWIRSEWLTNSNVAIFGGLILKAFNESLPKSDDEDPNQKSGQVKK